ncbi:hypothetical protein [uncultured Methanolobus sp.]|uniref:hypothetical protein n=1 Tax=uncultured Methanolobus sp. TaxID=218300 RepID=UPI0029C8805C|nr:hypothetical protein [uncultured Methanolobus sp.]
MSGRIKTGRFAIIGEYSAGKTALMTAIAYRDYLQDIPIYSNYHLEFPHTRITSVEQMDTMQSGTFIMDEAWYTFDSRAFGTKTNMKGSVILSKLAKRNMNAYLNMQSMDLLDSRFRDRMQAILIPEVCVKDETGKPLMLEVQSIIKDKWGFYNFIPKSYYFDISQVLNLYDTSEELDPLT